MAPSKKNHYRTVKYVSAKKPLTFQGDIAKNRAFETVIQESLTDEKKKRKFLGCMTKLLIDGIWTTHCFIFPR